MSDKFHSDAQALSPEQKAHLAQQFKEDLMTVASSPHVIADLSHIWAGKAKVIS